MQNLYARLRPLNLVVNNKSEQVVSFQDQNASWDDHPWPHETLEQVVSFQDQNASWVDHPWTNNEEPFQKHNCTDLGINSEERLQKHSCTDTGIHSEKPFQKHYCTDLGIHSEEPLLKHYYTDSGIHLNKPFGILRLDWIKSKMPFNFQSIVGSKQMHQTKPQQVLVDAWILNNISGHGPNSHKSSLLRDPCPLFLPFWQW